MLNIWKHLILSWSIVRVLEINMNEQVHVCMYRYMQMSEKIRVRDVYMSDISDIYIFIAWLLVTCRTWCGTSLISPYDFEWVCFVFKLMTQFSQTVWDLKRSTSVINLEQVLKYSLFYYTTKHLAMHVVRFCSVLNRTQCVYEVPHRWLTYMYHTTYM